MATDPSPTDVFEDAEIAREELFALLRDNYFYADTDPPVMELVDAILKAGYTRQSPASTTAADAWDEGARRVIDHNKAYPLVTPKDNPYRVAEPEGDGGNE